MSRKGQRGRGGPKGLSAPTRAEGGDPPPTSFLPSATTSLSRAAASWVWPGQAPQHAVCVRKTGQVPPGQMGPPKGSTIAEGIPVPGVVVGEILGTGLLHPLRVYVLRVLRQLCAVGNGVALPAERDGSSPPEPSRSPLKLSSVALSNLPHAFICTLPEHIVAECSIRRSPIPTTSPPEAVRLFQADMG